MEKLRVRYMGIELANPVVVAACSLSGHLDTICEIERLGAGALVIKSLFEEQIRHEENTLEQIQSLGNVGQESSSFFPEMPSAGPREHLMWVERARAAVKMPLIGSLNAATPESWVHYARKLADAGVDGLELNVYTVEADPDRDAAAVERELLDAVSAVRAETGLPLAVKLGPYYSALANVVSRLEAAGANAVVLFNRFLQPQIDPERQVLFNRMQWSTADEMRVPLRWTALLYGRVGLDLIGNTGVQSGLDVVKYLLAGAAAVQVAGVLYRRKPAAITSLLSELVAWMDANGYAAVEDFRGKLSQAHHPDNPAVFERTQYLDFLLRANGEQAVGD